VAGGGGHEVGDLYLELRKAGNGRGNETEFGVYRGDAEGAEFGVLNRKDVKVRSSEER
jgi:hypothetical protein